MSLARALTVRLRRHVDSSAPPSPLPTDSSSTMKRMASVIDRSKISSPVELISTTNMLSYNAPDVSTIQQQQLHNTTTTSSSSSSVASSASSSAARSSTDLTDASSLSPSPTDPSPNHLSCYFQQSPPSRSTSPDARAKTPIDPLAPAIPQRALSHSKHSHIALARQRSLRSVSTVSSGPHSPGLSRSGSLREQRHASGEAFKTTSVVLESSNGGNAAAHPFGRELEKLSEVVEELGGVMRDAEMRDDGVVMAELGLRKWSAEEYLVELGGLYVGAGAGFGEGNHPAAMIPAWI